MKRIKYYIGAFLLASLVSCDPKGTGSKQEEKDYGELKASFITMNMDGDTTRNFEIGEYVFFVDMSEGRPESRLWSTVGAERDSSNRLNYKLRYGQEGKYDVGITVMRDGETVDTLIRDYLTIEYIDVDAKMAVDVEKNRGKIYLKLGDYVTFSDASDGMPTKWDWAFQGGTPATSDKNVQKVQFREVGTFDVTIAVERGVSSDASRAQTVVVEPRVVAVQKAMYSDGKATLTFNEPLMITDVMALKADMTAEAKNEGSLYPLTVGNVNIKADDIYSLEVEVSGEVYQDDDMVISMGETSSLLDSTGLSVAPAFNTSCDLVGFEANSILDADYVGFENGNTAINNAYVKDYWITQTVGNDSYQRVTDYAYAGSASMRFSDEVAGSQKLSGMYFTDKTKNFNDCEFIPAGDYILYQPIYIPSTTTLKTFNFVVAERKDWSPMITVDWSLEGLPRDRWVVMRQKVTVGQDLGVEGGDGRTAGTRSDYSVAATGNEGIEGVQTFYLDGMAMVPLTNERP